MTRPNAISLVQLLGWLGALVLALTVSLSAAAEETRWSDTLERISSGVVSIRVDSTRAFDTEWNQSTQATGFVVDKERGLILTNRHVVTPGPVVAQAIFLNQEEVDLVPIYRDPVHDFGFFRYNPADLKFVEPVELALDPDGAQIGRDIRVVGNDAGEQLSILAGTIARLDRHAPDYGRGQYNDFNTFYFQAASGTSGGSSGSPVVDVDGQVVALNAGANNNAASSFFLPLDRIQRVFERIKAGIPVQRGTLQTEFIHKPFAELRRLGLSDSLEAEIRSLFPKQTGMLVVQQVIPESAAAAHLAPGDILTSINGERLVEFIPLAAFLDDAVGSQLELGIERGGKASTVKLLVDDLHAITPAEYIHFGDAIVHKLSYQQARHFNRSVAGIFVANPGYALGAAAIPRASIIHSINGIETNDLDELEAVLNDLGDGDRIAVRFISFDDPQTEKLRIVRMDRHWFAVKRCRRDDSTGLWPCMDLPAGPAAKPPAVATTSYDEQGDARRRRIAPSLVLVNFDMPYTISGVSERHYYGTGVIVDAARGRIVVDRNTVPVAMGDVTVTFAGSLEVPGRVEYIHPLHNLAVVAYDPALIGDTAVRSAAFNQKPVKPGDELWVAGLRGNHKLVSQATQVASIQPVDFPLSRTLRFRDSNLETIAVVNAPEGADGVLLDRRGHVVSLWSSFAFQGGRELDQVNLGVPAELVVEMLDHLERGEPLRSLEVEWRSMPLASARKLGLPAQWGDRYEKHNGERRSLLAVTRSVAGSEAAAFFQPGDLLLAIDGDPANTFREVERASQMPQVEVTIFRNGEALTQSLETRALHGTDVDRVVLWAGALVQAPHRALAAQRGIAPEGVYVSYFGYGSPATRYGLYAGRRILEVDDQATPDLDAFVEAVRGRGDREAVRLKTMTWNGVPEVITLKLDQHYWPGYELRRQDGSWQRFELN